jgi:hypothetical protein
MLGMRDGVEELLEISLKFIRLRALRGFGRADWRLVTRRGSLRGFIICYIRRGR